MKAGTHSALLKGSHTRAYTAKQGPSLPRPQRGIVPPAKFLLVRRAFIYIHFPVLCGPPLSAEEKKSDKADAINLIPAFHRVFLLLAQTAHVHFHGRKWVYTRLCSKDRTQGHTRRNTGRFGWGVVSLPSERSARSRTSPGRVPERRFCRFWALTGCAHKEHREPSGQRCAYARRCPEASRPRWAA